MSDTISGTISDRNISDCLSLQVRICEENVQELLPAARMLQLDYVVDQCGVFLEQHLSIQNCLGFYLFAGEILARLFSAFIPALTINFSQFQGGFPILTKLRCV